MPDQLLVKHGECPNLTLNELTANSSHKITIPIK